jgi:hypothetical protein
MKGSILQLLRMLLVTSLWLTSYNLNAQGILDKVISVQFSNEKLENVLEIISNKGNFYFSYNSNIIKRDSLVSLTAYNKSVKQVLDFLFNDRYEYKESSNYIIIRRAPVTLSLITNQAITEDKIYTVSGYVLDDESGERVSNASIYEKQRLVSTLTNEEGYFKLRLKSKSGTAALTVSKQFYQDTTVIIRPNYNQQVRITILPVEFTGKMITVSPEDYLIPDSITIEVEVDASVTRYLYLKADSIKVEKTAVGNFLLSTAQQVQTINLKSFFADRPYQFSITPGLSTHGKLSGQVINNFSLNILGGYTGGVNGVEIGGLFNIDKKAVRYIQAGGLFNIVGGRVLGLQAAGIHNTVLDSVTGLQFAGVNNMVKGRFTGLQAAGIYNHVSGKFSGAQIAGVSNYSRQKVSGVQIAGIGNFSNREMSGVQIAGVFNYAKKMKGVQIGLINVSNTFDGLGIGLINVVFKGYHKLSISSNEVLNTNLAFKTGHARLYNILQAGMHVKEPKENLVFSFGYGLGTELPLGKTFSVNPEVTAQYIYLGSWDHVNLLNKASLNLNIKFAKWFSIFGGPSFSAYYTDQTTPFGGYRLNLLPDGYRTVKLPEQVTGWIGWNAGINFF